ncbi:hypothetical protein [Actinomadura sp. 7K507]|uniref:hypothetical protein n=1 Tax=Actinomadura sp. 7K507 TaxID=2530365 RepID=UPI00104FA970|nr:hypothetical protein [Actinomadura sp. 7K507]TDC97727.1 hypothetical protein E1285_02570 [Actinomadura sp. 7K507]
MTATGRTWPVTLTKSQAEDIAMVVGEEAIIEAEKGDPRNVVDACTAVSEFIRSQPREGDQVEVALTAGWWDIAVAALDQSVFYALHRGDLDEADSPARVRDAVLAQVAEHLPARPRQEATARHSLIVENAYGYILFQPSRRGRYRFKSIDASMLHDYGTPSISTVLNGAAAVVQVRTREVNLQVQVLPAAPELDRAAWESIAEITQLWASFPYPELVLAVPGQEGTVLWDLTTELWPHVTYRMRLSLNASGRAAEDHLLQMWPDHTTPPTVHKAAHKPDR